MKPTNHSRLMNRLITNKIIQDLSSYLSSSYLIFYLCFPYYLIFYDHQQFSCSVWLFTSCNFEDFVSCNVQFFVSCSILSFVSIDGFVNCNIQFFISCNFQYQAFLFISEYYIESIGNPKNLLDYLVGLSLSRHSYLYRIS